MEHGDWLASFIGKTVVAEIGEGFTVFGAIESIGPTYIEFSKADLHNQHEANSTRDMYAIEVAELGIRPNRDKLFIPRDRLICLSCVEDIQG